MTNIKSIKATKDEGSADEELSWPDPEDAIDYEKERLHRKQRLAAGLRV